VSVCTRRTNYIDLETRGRGPYPCSSHPHRVYIIYGDNLQLATFAIGPSRYLLFGIISETMANAPQGKRVQHQHQDLRQDLLVDPLPSDVMLGRGRAFLRHPGNQRLNTVVKLNINRYLNAANRNEKTSITEEIVHIIQTYGSPPGRFLRYKPKSGGWYEVDDEEARVKVSHTVRYRRKCNEIHEVSESTDSSLSHSGEQSDTIVSGDHASSLEEATLPVCGAHQLQRVKSAVSNSTTIPILFDEAMLTDLECDAAILADLGTDIICLSSEQDSYDPNQHGDFIF
jgi:hypothetical protein